MESKFNDVFNEAIEQYNEAKRVQGKETVVSKGIKKFGDVKFSSKISTQTFGVDGEDGTNVYHDFSFVAPAKDLGKDIGKNWVRPLSAGSDKKAISVINKEVKDLDRVAKLLTKTLNIVNARSKNLKDAKEAIMDEGMKVIDLEKKSK
jgi:hypothetical protein